MIKQTILTLGIVLVMAIFTIALQQIEMMRMRRSVEHLETVVQAIAFPSLYNVDNDLRIEPRDAVVPDVLTFDLIPPKPAGMHIANGPWHR